MLDKLQQQINYTFKDVHLLEQALDRRAYISSIGKKTYPFERLEFVGDRVLNLTIADILFRIHPDWTPSQMNTVYVHYTRNTDGTAKHGGPLYRVAKVLQLKNYLLLDKKAVLDMGGKRGKPTKRHVKTEEHNLSDHVEALIGAIYEDSGRQIAIVSQIIETLFTPLGLLEADHVSVSNYGESQSVQSREEMARENSELNQQFLKLITSGNLIDLLDMVYQDINSIQATYGLLIALNNNHLHIVTHLVKTYDIDLQIIREELANPGTDTHSTVYGFLKNYLVVRLIQKHQQTPLEELDQIDLFLRLTEQGNTNALKNVSLIVPNETVAQGFELAVRAGKSNMVTHLVKEYEIGTDTLQLVLDNADSLDTSVEGFLRRQLKSNAKLLLSPTKTRGTVFSGTTNNSNNRTHVQILDTSPVTQDNSAIKEDARDVNGMEYF